MGQPFRTSSFPSPQFSATSLRPIFISLIVKYNSMFPFQKIFTLLIRTFSRPMLAYVKRKQQQKAGFPFSGVFVRLGRRAYSFESWVNVRILKTTHRKHHSELKEEVLLEKGIQSFYQIIFYLIILGMPFWELYKSSIAAQKKEENLQKRFSNLENRMIHINQKITKVVEYAKQRSLQEKQRSREVKKRSQKKLGNIKVAKLEGSSHADNEMGQMGPEEEGEKAEKLEDILENAIEVVADEFEDILDEMEFNSPDQAGESLDEAPDSSIDIEGEGQSGLSGLQQVDLGGAGLEVPDIDVQAGDPEVEIEFFDSV